MQCLRNRWGVTYDLRLVLKGERFYLQMMWGYLEKQSFPLKEMEYCEKLEKVLEIINRLGKSNLVRHWLLNTKQKPSVGRAISLLLRGDEQLEEFVL
nr:DUF3067 family protein [Prochlorococcus marinus]